MWKFLEKGPPLPFWNYSLQNWSIEAARELSLWINLAFPLQKDAKRRDMYLGGKSMFLLGQTLDLPEQTRKIAELSSPERG